MVLQLSQAQYSVLSLDSALVVQLYFRFAEEANSMIQVGIQVLEQEVKSKLEEVCTLHWRSPPKYPSFSFSALSLVAPPAGTPSAALVAKEAEDLLKSFQDPEKSLSSYSADSPGPA